MIGTIKFSSRVRFGRNKRNIPFYEFINNDNDKYIVASKKGQTTKIDHYAIIEILDSNSNPKRCAIKQIIGPVDNYEFTKKYILYSNQITPNKIIDFNYTNSVNELPIYDINTFSIDPEGSKDIDDAFTILENNILIHITDLTDIEFSDFSKLIGKATTFYDKEGNINMLSEEISENKSSLLENQVRNSITLNIETGEFFKSQIIVNKNLTYEEADDLLTKDELWKSMVSKLKGKFGVIDDSHILIEKMMIHYNNQLAILMFKRNLSFPLRVHSGINKDLFEKYNKTEYSISDDLLKKICYHAASYENSLEIRDPKHYGLNLDYYTHGTSPLRRVIDLINQRIAFNNETFDINNICEIVNEKIKKVKRAYTNIKKLNLLGELKDSVRVFDAIVFNIEENSLNVFIPDLDIIQRIKLFPDKINDIFVLKLNETNIEIKHKLYTEKIIISLLQQIKIKAMITTREASLNRKLRFYILEPDILTLLD